MRELKSQVNDREHALESAIRGKEKAQQQFIEQQNFNADLVKRMEIIKLEIANRDDSLSQANQKVADREAEKDKLREQLITMTDQLASLQSDSGYQAKENETQLSEMLERIRGKDLVIDANTNEMRQLKSTLKSQETSIAYFKQQV